VSALLGNAPLATATVRGLLDLLPHVHHTLLRNPLLGEAAWRVLYAPGASEDAATALLDRPLTRSQVKFALVTRVERRKAPLVALLRHGQCTLPPATLPDLLRAGPEVRAALAVATSVPPEVRAAAAASVPSGMLRPVAPSTLARLHGEFRPYQPTPEEFAQAAEIPAAGLALQPWQVQRAAGLLAAQACGTDLDAWMAALELVRHVPGPLGQLLAVAPAVAA
jgi:hypothetical protein